MNKPIMIMLASAAATAGLFSAVAAPAQVFDQSQPQVSRVRTADLDLRSEAGKRRLEARLARAVREVCGTETVSDLAGKNEVRRCREATMADLTGRKDQLIAAARGTGEIAIASVR